MRTNPSLSLLNIFLLAFALGVYAQKAPVHPDSASPPHDSDELHASSSDVIVESGDLLTVSVAGAPEYHYDVRVSSEGNVSLPMLGNIKVAGLSTLQAERVIAQRLQEKGFFNDPQVSIFVKEYATAGISVLG